MVDLGGHKASCSATQPGSHPVLCSPFALWSLLTHPAPASGCCSSHQEASLGGAFCTPCSFRAVWKASSLPGVRGACVALRFPCKSFDRKSEVPEPLCAEESPCCYEGSPRFSNWAILDIHGLCASPESSSTSVVPGALWYREMDFAIT